MATYYGSLVNNVFRSYLTVTTTETATAMTISVESGLNIPSSGYTTSRSFTSVISGTGGLAGKSGSLSYGTYTGTLTKKITTTSYSISKTHAAQSFTISAVLTANGISTTSTASTSPAISVPAKASYTVSFNKNTTDAVSNMPGSQTKWYGETLTLSSTKPTRAGYTFVRWNTNASGSGTNYNAGGSYTSNAAVTLYAVWQKNTFAVTYNANGGTGSIADQTKVYNEALTLSNGAGFARDLYKLKKWNTAAAGGGTDYALGDTYTGNAALTLYAQWELDYTLPIISSLQVYRVPTSASTTETDDGEYIRITFDYTGGSLAGVYIKPTCTVKIGSTTAYNQQLANTSGTFSQAFGTYSKDQGWAVEITLADANYPTGVTVYATINTATYALDLVSSGTDIYVGINHPAKTGQDVTTAELYADGLFIAVDDAAASGTDKDLKTALMALGWWSDVTS